MYKYMFVRVYMVLNYKQTNKYYNIIFITNISYQIPYVHPFSIYKYYTMC